MNVLFFEQPKEDEESNEFEMLYRQMKFVLSLRHLREKHPKQVRGSQSLQVVKKSQRIGKVMGRKFRRNKRLP